MSEVTRLTPKEIEDIRKRARPDGLYLRLIKEIDLLRSVAKAARTFVDAHDEMDSDNEFTGKWDLKTALLDWEKK